MRLQGYGFRPRLRARGLVTAVQCSMIACMDALLYNG
jgi:hypothetical protein